MGKNRLSEDRLLSSRRSSMPRFKQTLYYPSLENLPKHSMRHLS